MTMYTGLFNKHQITRSSSVIKNSFISNRPSSTLWRIYSNNNNNSFINHPSIIQRDLLREYYLTSNSNQQIDIIQQQYQTQPIILDVHTTLHLLCHTADLSKKGQLEGDAIEQSNLVHYLVTILLPHIHTMKNQLIATLLWGVSSVPSACSSEWTNELAETVSCQEVSKTDDDTAHITSYNTKELINIIVALGKLTYSVSPSSSVWQYTDTLVAELGLRIENEPYVKASFTLGNYAELISSCARLYGGSNNSNGDNDTSDRIPQSVRVLFDTVAKEVRRQLANKHSTRSLFFPRELASFLYSYAYLSHKTDASIGMLDACAGFIAYRINSKHINAVKIPEDMLLILQSYVVLDHRSIAVPQMLTAIGEQLRYNAVNQQDFVAMEKSAVTVDGGGGGDGGFRPQDIAYCPLDVLNSILDSHLTLGYRPNDLLLTALMPGVIHMLGESEREDVRRLLEIFAVCEWSPGDATVELMMSRL